MADKQKLKVPAEDHEEETEVEDTLMVAKPKKVDKHPDGKISKFFETHRFRKSLAVVGLLVLILMIIPMTRYKVLGLFIQKSYSVTVLDSETSKPVSGADVTLTDKKAQTDANGKVTLTDVKPGGTKLKITKRYYSTYEENTEVSLSEDKNVKDVKLQAIGRQVPVTVKNKFNGKVLANVTISVLDTTAKTDAKGEAIIVLPPDKTTQIAQANLNGYNAYSGEIEVTEQFTEKNVIKMTPEGKIYFLSKKSGNIDVVKTNLDGSNRETVLAGTGKEEDETTVLLATRDWKYLALRSKRDGKSKIYLIETANDKISIIDDGNTNYEITGWQNHDFVYISNRTSTKIWQSNKHALKSFNADNKTLTVIRSSQASGTGNSNFVAESFGSPYLLNNKIVYTISWDYCCGAEIIAKKKIQIIEGKSGSTESKVLKSLSQNDYSFITSKPYQPDEIYFGAYLKFYNFYEFYEYNNGTVQAADVESDVFLAKTYPRYIQSPSGNSLFWSESRDGKKTLFIGDKEAKNKQEIMSLGEYTTYGWYTDDYLLVSKGDSELYILTNAKGSVPLKITDYHKPEFNYIGYGGGY